MPWPLPDGAALGLFAKQPLPGQVKTRLAAALGNEQAAAIAEAMLFDTLDLWGAERILAPGGRRVVVFDPPDAGPWFDVRTPDSFALQPQAQGDLGARMKAFFEGEFDDGATRVVLIGSDSPTLDPSFVVSAFLLLEHKDIVLGPATDGGYYLIGARPPLPPLFDGIAWSTPGVLAETCRHLAASGRSLAVLPPWYDIDTPADYQMLTGHIQAMRLAGMNPGLPRLERLVARTDPPQA